MSILLKPKAKVIAHSADGAYAEQILSAMASTGVEIVGAVSPGGRGQTRGGLPIFPTAADAVAATGADTAVLFTPPPWLGDAICEMADAGITLAAAATEHAPQHDVMRAAAHARAAGMWLIGPNSLGLYSPDAGLLLSLPPEFATKGRVGILSRSGTMTILSMRLLQKAGIGLSTAVSVGGDYIIGRRPAEYLALFEQDPETDAVLVLGEIGGGKETEIGDCLSQMTKPVVSLIIGESLPENRTFGHAGALATGGLTGARAKKDYLAKAGAHVAQGPADAVAVLRGLLAAQAAAQ